MLCKTHERRSLWHVNEAIKMIFPNEYNYLLETFAFKKDKRVF